MNRLAKYFSPATSAVLRRAQQYADNRSETLTTSHIVKALFEVDRTVAYDLLRSATKNKISLVKNSLQPKQDEIPTLIQISAKYAQNYNFALIEPEHLLLAIFDETNFVGHKLLIANGVKIKVNSQKLAEWLFGVSLLQSANSDHGPLNQTVDTADKSTKTESAENIIHSATTDLTKLAKEGKLTTVVGREVEIRNIVRTLIRHKKNNPLLIGDPGVGKTAIVHGLAQMMVDNKVPGKLANMRILELSVASLVAGTVYRGQFEDKVRKLIDAVKKEGNTLLFIDEIHTMSGAGSTEGALDLANILKPVLAQGDLSIIGATTHDEYTKHFADDRALARRFQTHFVKEPDRKVTINMVKSVIPFLERHHTVNISRPLITLAVDLADRFLPDRPFPDKAIDILDEACAETHINLPPNTAVTKLKARLRKTLDKKYKLIDAGKLNEAVQLREQEQKLMEQLLSEKDKEIKRGERTEVTTDTLINVVSRLSNVPINIISTTYSVDLTKLKKVLNNKVIGQKGAIEQVVKSLGRAQAGFKKKDQPIASYIFIGPTGVGKTHLAKTMAEHIFGSKEAIIKIDMSELSERHTISQLVGSPKGYVGHDDTGTLVDQVKRNPHAVILFDEVEKAHPDIFNILLQILEDGSLTDTKGRKAYFRHNIIVLTSNIGTDEWQKAGLGFSPTDDSAETKTKTRLKEHFRPELLSRLTTVINFQPFTKADIKRLIKKRLHDTKLAMKNNQLKLAIDDSVISWLSGRYDQNKGARSVDELIKNRIEDLLVDHILNTKNKPAQINIVEDKIKISSL